MEKRKIVFGIIVCLLFALAVCPFLSYAGNNEKVAFVDVGILFDKYEKTKIADQELTALANERQKQRDTMVEEIRRMKDELVVLAQDGEERKVKQASIDQKIKDLQGYDEQQRQDLTRIRNEKAKVVFDDLNAAIESYGKKKGYDFIYNGRMLLYKENKFDITNALLDEINKSYDKTKKK
jgi:outer membrane protein